MNDFAGATYDRDRDFARLKTQLRRVHALMLDGQERTLHSIAMSCGGTEAAVSARLRPNWLLLRHWRPACGSYTRTAITMIA